MTRLQYHRQTKNLSQFALARECGLTQKDLSVLERFGKKTSDERMRLEQFFGESLESLLTPVVSS